jgi:hypothetical protein
MKKGNIKYFLFVLIVLNFGCKKTINVTTTVHPDGSFLRIVEVSQSDSTSVPESAFRIPKDSTWTVEIKRVHKDSNVFIYRAEKYFKTLHDINAYFNCETDTVKKINSQIYFDKRFRWFFTYFDYREVYPAYNPFKLVPIKSLLTEEEFNDYQAKGDSSIYKEKFEQWTMRAIFEEFYQVLIAGADRLKNPQLTRTLIEAKKEELFSSLMKAIDQKDSQLKDLLKVCEGILKTSAVWQLEPDLNKCQKSIQKKLEFWSAVDEDSYTNKVIMPGLLMDTNAAKMEGNQVIWEIEHGQFFNSDLEMKAVSRITNQWTIYVTIGLCVIILGALAVTMMRKQG